MDEEKSTPEERPYPVTPLWKRILALLAAFFVLFLSFAFTWALDTGNIFWI